MCASGRSFTIRCNMKILIPGCLKGRPRSAARLLLLSCLLASATVRAASLAGSIGASSDYVLRGISRNGGELAVQGDVHLLFTPGWSAGFWGSQVQLMRGRHTLELDSYLQWQHSLSSDFDLALSVTHYAYPHDPRPINYNYTELSVSLSWRDQIFATIGYAPDVNLFTTYGNVEQRDKRVFTYELAAHRSLSAHLDAVAGLGFYEPQHVDYGSYTYGSASLAWHYGKWRADLAWIAVQRVEHRWFTQGPAGGPLTLGVAWSF